MSVSSTSLCDNSGRGRFIVLDGPDGSGKSTQTRLLKERLEAAGKTVRIVREPGGTPLSEQIRSLILSFAQEEPVARAETLLFIAARAQVAAKIIQPALDRGEWVVCDRFTFSTIAYQGYGRGLDLDAIKAMNAFALPQNLAPDAVIFLDVPVETTRRRLAIRQGGSLDNIESRDDSFHNRVRQGFIDQYNYMTAAGRSGVALLNASISISGIEEAIWKSIAHLL